MFSVSHRTLVRVSGFLLILSLMLMPGLAGKHSPVSLTGSITSADASTPRSYSEFIDGAYFGALGRFPTCEEEQAEYDALVSATSAGNRLAEARRFVSTLFETQASFDDPGGTYCQTTEYEARNPAYCNPLVNERSDGFITDLYGAFLLRQPEQAGFNYWMSAIQPPNGRKVVLNGFRDSTEFGVIVGALYQGARPDCGGGGCQISCPRGYTLDPDTCECIPPCEGANATHFNPLCQQ
jgi:hypothetical protein